MLLSIYGIICVKWSDGFEFVVAFYFEICIIDMGMKFSLGKPKLLIKADDFCDYISQESLAFLRIKEEFSC